MARRTSFTVPRFRASATSTCRSAMPSDSQRRRRRSVPDAEACGWPTGSDDRTAEAPMSDPDISLTSLPNDSDELASGQIQLEGINETRPAETVQHPPDPLAKHS